MPVDIAFLPELTNLSIPTLARAAQGAARLGVPAFHVLVADGAISETLYYRCLARHLGLPFVSGWPTLHRQAAPTTALRTGIVALATNEDHRWLAAPAGRDIKRLLVARERDALPSAALAITTPSHLADVICERGKEGLALSAAEALPSLAPRLSARDRHRGWIGPAAVAMAALSGASVALSLRPALDLFGLLFFSSMVARLLVFAEGLRTEPPADDALLEDAALPPYSVLVPLYHEAGMVAELVRNLDRLDYPREKLEILLLLERDDHATLQALGHGALPPQFRVVVAPPGTPRTKPRALNIGLMQARGELVTVFDAEDRPERDQLRKAASRFAREPDGLACLQARLAISNASVGLLPALFALEYAALFDVFAIGSARLGWPMALGGTSNHFRASVLRGVGAWDSWNVTEDADLGIRLARFGFRVGCLDSTTWEAAPTRLSVWIKQRRRWCKGWMQTALVFGCDAEAIRDLGFKRSAYVALLLTSLVTGSLAAPIFAGLVALHVALEGFPSTETPLQLAEATLFGTVFGLGIASPVWCHFAGARARGLRRLLALVPLMPPYALMVSCAAWAGLFDLFHDPYHWHKTDHGSGAMAQDLNRSWRAAPPPRRRVFPRRRRG